MQQLVFVYWSEGHGDRVVRMRRCFGVITQDSVHAAQMYIIRDLAEAGVAGRIVYR